MEQKTNKKHPLLLTLIKVALSLGALYLVYRKIDIQEMFAIIKKANIFWLLLAIVLFNGSQILSAKRLLKFFHAISIKLSFRNNLTLYYIGMFYNLFLPGGLGGDGYKVYLLHKKFNKSAKKLIAILLHDRVNGLFGLASLLAILLIYNVPEQYKIYGTTMIVGIIASVIGYILVYRWLFKSLTKTIILAFFLSIGIQGLQVLTAVCILMSLGLEANFLIYLQLFLISSIVSVLPITIGGVGARELVYIYGSTIFYIDKNIAIAFTLLFFLITAISSLTGVIPNSSSLEDKIKNGLVP